jgi:hypothetical protein
VKKESSARVAFFPDTYHEIDGVANTSRHFEAFARRRGLPFLIVHAGSQNETVAAGSVTKVQLRRSQLNFPLDGVHHYDVLFLRHYRRVARLVRDFNPHVVQITSPADVGVLGTLIAHMLGIPLVASCGEERALPRAARRGTARQGPLPPGATYEDVIALPGRPRRCPPKQDRADSSCASGADVSCVQTLEAVRV